MYIYILVSTLLQVMLAFISSKINYNYDKYKIIAGVILSDVLACLISNKFGVNLNSIILLLICNISISSSLIDFKYQEIPDTYNITTAILGLIYVLLNRYQPYVVSIGGYQFKYYEMLLLGATIIFILFFAIAFFTGTLGGGDVKMGAALGLLIPFTQVLTFLTAMCSMGAIVALVLMIFKKKKMNDFFAFGPCIALASFYCIIFII